MHTQAHAVAVSGSYAYVAASHADGLTVVLLDLHSPPPPPRLPPPPPPSPPPAPPPMTFGPGTFYNSITHQCEIASSAPIVGSGSIMGSVTSASVLDYVRATRPCALTFAREDGVGRAALASTSPIMLAAAC